VAEELFEVATLFNVSHYFTVSQAIPSLVSFTIGADGGEGSKCVKSKLDPAGS
jgi:hypothetical protein